MEALIIRDMMARFGRNNLGFVWTIIEPMILCVGVLGIWSMLLGHIVHGVPVLTFVLSGYMYLTLWRHMTNSQILILKKNVGLLYHRRISHFDIIFARAFLEFTSTTAALMMVYFVLVATGLVPPVQNWTLVLLGWLLSAIYYGGMGFLIAAMTQCWETSEKFIQPAQYWALPISGVFFMVDWLPSSVQRIALWNPSVSAVEMIRAGYVGNDAPTHYDVGYLAAWSFLMVVLGILSIYAARDRLEFS